MDYFKKLFNGADSVEQFFGALLGCQVKLIEVNFTGFNGLEDSTWRYFQFVTLNPDKTKTRYEVGTLNGKVFFELCDELYDEPLDDEFGYEENESDKYNCSKVTVV